MCYVANTGAGWANGVQQPVVTFEPLDNSSVKHTVLSAAQTLSDSWTSATGPAFLAANLKIVDLITPPVGEPMQAAKTIFIWLLCGEKFWQLQGS